MHSNSDFGRKDPDPLPPPTLPWRPDIPTDDIMVALVGAFRFAIVGSWLGPAGRGQGEPA